MEFGKFKKLAKLFIFLIFSLAFISCSEVQDEDDEAIRSALIALSEGECQEAITILDGMSNTETNARWYQTRASAQACFTSFNEITFFASDVDLIDTTNLTTLGRSFPLFSTSDDMTVAGDSEFVNLHQAVNILISAGNVEEFSYASRATVFTSNENANISMQALYFSAGNLGHYMRFFGNANPTTGAKGGGAGGNGCYMDYTDGVAAVIIGGALTGSCLGAGDAHPDMTDARACNGIVLINTIFNTLQNIDIPDDSGSLSSVDDTINTLITTCQGTLVPNRICTVVNQDLCEAEGNALIQRYFALIMEQLHI